jgi:hypothetical protein
MKKTMILLLLVCGLAFSQLIDVRFGDGEFTTIEVDSLHARTAIVDGGWGVFAYLPSRDTTTCTTADTWYFIQGAFANPIAEGFAVGPTGIISTLPDTVFAEIDWHATILVDPAGATVHAGIGLNDSVYVSSIMGTFASTIELQMSGTVVMEVVPSDTISLKVMSDADGDDVIFIHFTTTIRNFFH